MLQQLASVKRWDICIIGGGATGLGIAVDAASRGYKTLLLEKIDFAKGTSSRSTKLVHGGVRYLQQGNIKLVMEALKERGLLMKNAPSLVLNQSFVVPNYKWWEGPFYGIGLKVYDWMAGSLGLGPSRFLSREEVLEQAPTLEPTGLRGGILYHDGQFDDARLAISLALTAAFHGGTVINYFEVQGLMKGNGKLEGIKAIDTINGKEYEIRSRVVINASGVFTDVIMQMDEEDHEPLLSLSQGIHLVTGREFLAGTAGIMIPRTDDGRVLFAVPWHDRCVLGTTDTPVKSVTDEPVPFREEISFILQHMGRYLAKKPGMNNITSVFAGLRPLVKGTNRTTAELSRDHLILINPSGLVTVTGGKWTTYRRMAEDAMELVIGKFGLPAKECSTANLLLRVPEDLHREENITATNNEDAAGEYIHPNLHITSEKIRFSVRNEMCMTVDDALSRRTRALFLDAQAAIDSAPLVAKILATEMNRSGEWMNDQVEQFGLIARNYLVQ